MELAGGDEAVLVEVVEVEGVAELLVAGGGAGVGLGAGVGAVELGELVEVDEAVAVGVDLGHNASDLGGIGVGAECAEDVLELGAGDLAVAVLVELVEDLLDLRHGAQRAGTLGARLRRH